MPQITKSLFYAFFVLQFLLHVTFINSAAIKREKRSISTNATVMGTSIKEVDPATVTTQEDVRNVLFETTTKEKLLQDTTTIKKEDTTLMELRLDENTVALSSDSDEEAPKDNIEDEKEDVIVKNKNEETTAKVSLDEFTKNKINETTTILPIFENEKTTWKNEVSISAFENSTQLSEVSVDNTELPSTTEKEQPTETTFRNSSQISENTTLFDTKLEETTNVNKDNAKIEINETTLSTDSDSVEENTTNSIAIDSTTKITEEFTSQNLEDAVTDMSVDKVTETLNEHVQNELTDASTKFPHTTLVTNEYNESSTIAVQNVSNQYLTDETTASKSDEITIFETSTETFTERPIKTLLSDLKSNDDLRISTPSSTEKRGKFIDHNYSSFNDLRLPNNSDVWALAGLRSAGKPKSSEIQNSVETSEEKPMNNSMATKSLLDWTRVMASTDEMDLKTTLKTSETPHDKTTEKLTLQETTKPSFNQENEVEQQNIKVETETTTVAISLTDQVQTDKNSDSTHVETTTETNEKHQETTLELHTTDETLPIDAILSTTTSSLKALKNHHKLIEENKVDGDIFEKEKTPIPTTTTTTTVTPIPAIVTMKSETTISLGKDESTQEANAGTTSLPTSSLSDFTTSIPFLATTTAITTTTTAVVTDITTTTPPVIINMDESPNKTSTKMPTKTSSPAIMTTTMPAVTIMAATTETQTTVAPHTPAIISNDTKIIIQKGNNNYNEYEVVNTTTEKYADNSSTEAFEATTRFGLTNWSTNVAEISTTEVDKLDEVLDVTTASNFENNNAYDTESTTSVISTVTLAPKTNSTETATKISVITATEDLDHIDPIHKISDTAETSIESNVIDPVQVGETSTTTTTTTTTTTESYQENMKMHSTEKQGVVDSMYSTSTTTTTTSTSNYDDSATTLQSISTKQEDVYSIVPTIDNGGFHVPKLVLDDTTTLMPPGELGVGVGVGIGGGSVLQPIDSPDAQETDVNVIIAISVSTVGIIALILLVAFLYVMRKRQKQMSYGQRCRPVSLDAYSLDNVSVYNSVRRKGATLRASKRSYGNVAFDDPSLRHNVLGTHELARYVEKKSSIWEEFKEVPQIIARADEVPAGCEDKNRYANVIPLPETRVILQQQNGDEKSEYINANYVRGPKDTNNYYIACQAPLETTVTDFWRMIWEQNSRVIIMATDLIENGIDKCAEYLPPSVTLDNHTVFGDYQVTLKHRDVKEKYATSTLMLKNTINDESREITHYWYQWPEAGVPTDEAAVIAMLLEARSSLKVYAMEQGSDKIETIMAEDNNSSAKSEINGNLSSEKQKPSTKDQGPLTIHCSPGTGRTGTILACDIAMRCLEEPKRTVDIPQIVYSVRRGRASAVQTKEQYEFIYKVTHMYATKISNINNDN